MRLRCEELRDTLSVMFGFLSIDAEIPDLSDAKFLALLYGYCPLLQHQWPSLAALCTSGFRLNRVPCFLLRITVTCMH